MRTRCSENARCLSACALALCTLAVAGCARRQHAPPAAPESSVATLHAWPQGHTAPLKITDDLVLEIPLEYERSAIYRDQKPARALISTPSDRSEVQFDFFLPGFTGYTLENYRNDSDENKVEIVYLHAGDPHEADPDAPGEYPPNMLKRALQEFLNPNDYQDLYGLRCYRGRIASDRLGCYGRRDEARREDILLYVPQPPYAPGVFPQIQARYFSTRYGGVRIAWRTHVKNLPRWHEIDAQIWKFIEEWRVGLPAAPPGPSEARPAPAEAQPRK
jgi:hypothetical protein